MPIKPENKARYPKDWPAISRRIRFERAGGRCECTGMCGRHRYQRCEAVHGKPSVRGTGAKVVLTVAHLCQTPECTQERHLVAMCQACHLAYDIDTHVANARETRRKKNLERQPEMFA